MENRRRLPSFAANKYSPLKIYYTRAIPKNLIATMNIEGMFNEERSNKGFVVLEYFDNEESGASTLIRTGDLYHVKVAL